MNEKIIIYLDCEPIETLEEFGKRFYRRDINPTTTARCIWNVYKKGYILSQGVVIDDKLVLYGLTGPEFRVDTKKYSDTLKAVNLGEI